MKNKQRLSKISIVMALMLIFTCFNNSNIVGAMGTDPRVSGNISDLEDGSLKNFTTESTPQTRDQVVYDVTDLILNESNVTLETTADHAFIDVIGVLSDGNFVSLGDLAEWYSDDYDIAYPNKGRILGTGVGTATVTVAYNGIQKSIEVNVMDEYVEPMIMPMAIPSQYDIIYKAGLMKNLNWTITKTLFQWHNSGDTAGSKKFSAGTHTGIPYSQFTNQCDEVGFKSNLTKSDFYTTAYNTHGLQQPRYGNDCSAFVSYAWGISRKTTSHFYSEIGKTYAKVGSYTLTSSKSVMVNAYKSLIAGDALVKEGHIFLVYANNGSTSITAYEQTPPKATTKTWTYDQLYSSGYMPIRLK